ncbi:MAG: short chain dehydrogenase [Gemmataceae bacterium]
MGNRRELKDKRVLITGASQGIGRALALATAREGCRLVLTARTADLLDQVAREVQALGAQVATVAGDVTDANARRQMLAVCQSRFGGLDILINNAGVGATGHFVEASPERLRRIMEVNFFAPAELIREAFPLLRAGNQPLIVNISSIVGKRAVPARSEYSASKFALQGLSEALRAELVRFGIDVLVVSPGLTATRFAENMLEHKARAPMDHMRSLSPEAVAQATLRAMKRGKNELVLTWQGKLFVLASRWFPRLVDYFSAQRVRRLYPEDLAELAKRQSASAAATARRTG